MASTSSSQIKKRHNNVDESVKIKDEPNEVQPLSFYVDDRVELIRQTFNCLKGKVIKSMLPSFLQGKSMDQVQEQCLDELLGISKKRLLSIINATKCPSDTESSDGSDVEKIIEHISLDEISSDDDFNNKSKKTSKKSGDRKNKKENGTKEPAKDGKEVSVLELLELQARARAIRSQLAHEPITKIELDSDNDSESEKDSDKESALPPPSVPVSKKVPEPVPTTDHQPKRVKLDRNFRKRIIEDDKDSQSNDTENEKEKEKVKSKSDTKSVAEKTKVKKEINKISKDHESDERCDSPDIITVIPSPETFCILDSDDENLDVNVSTESKNDKSPEKSNEPPEDGELIEDESKANEEITIEKEKDKEKNDLVKTSDKETEISEKRSQKKRKHRSKKVESPEVSPKKLRDESPEISKTKAPDKSPDLSVDKYDDDTLTVDLAKEELNYSDSETSEEDEEEEVPPTKADEDDIETFDIDDSSNEVPTDEPKDEETASFHERWLGSKKVSKILATSRLGNRVRENIKMKKAAAAAKSDSDNSNPIAENIESVVEPEHNKFEEGSVQQYEVLLSKNDEDQQQDDKISEENDESGELKPAEDTEKVTDGNDSIELKLDEIELPARKDVESSNELNEEKKQDKDETIKCDSNQTIE